MVEVDQDFLDLMDQSDSGESIELEDFPKESYYRKCLVVLYTSIGIFRGIYIYIFSTLATAKDMATPQPDF